MKIAILGYAGQGKSAYEYWTTPENEITICDRDKNVELPKLAAGKLGPDYLKDLGKYDLLVRTPSLHPSDIAEANPDVPDILDKVTTVTNEFFRASPSKNIIGVTGTKGKGTTSTLIAKMLQAAGKRVHLGGNIGIPPLELLKDNIQPDDWVVLELANFQLIDLKYSPRIGVCLMVVPEHMDWHENMNEYVAAKQQMFAHQSENDFAVYYPESEFSEKIVSVSKGVRIPYMKAPGATVTDRVIGIGQVPICKVGELKLLGQHNWQNVCAAITAVWQITQEVDALRSVLTTFTGLEHRLELVRELNGVKYYDDSFGTTPETAIVAIEAFDEPKVVILGGSDKGAKYDELAKTVSQHNVRSVVLIGDTAPKIQTALENVGYQEIVNGGEKMEQIVKTARDLCLPGDIVLLSTGCASFGLFENYKDRGEQFKKAVLSLS